MASEPYFDRGWWCCKWKPSLGGTWRKERLVKQQGWKQGQPTPKKPPLDAKTMAAEFARKEEQARQTGVATAGYGGNDLAEYAAAYLSLARHRMRPGSFSNVQHHVGLFLAWAKERGLKTVQSVTAAHAREYITSRLAVNAPKSVATEKSLIAPIWAQALDEGLIPVNPWRKIKTIQGRPREEHPPFWTREECDKLIAACEGRDRDIVIVGLNTGLRVSALLGMEWSWIRWEEGEVHVPAAMSKGGRTIRVPISEAAHDVLARRLKSADGPYVFATRTGRPLQRNVTFACIKRAVAKAGVPDHGHYNHAMRHTFASLAVMSGIPLAVVSSWLGHTSVQMTMKYAHLAPSESARHMATFSVGANEKTLPE